MANTNISGVHVWLVMWKATSALEGHALRNIESLGICHSDFAVLEALLHKGPLPVNAIGRKVLLTSGSITTAVDRLEKLKLVERKWEQEDRRVCDVHLTKAGRDLIEPAFKDHARAMEEAVAGLSVEERTTLVELVKKLGRRAQEKLTGPVEVQPVKVTVKKMKTKKVSVIEPVVAKEEAGFGGYEGLD